MNGVNLNQFQFEYDLTWMAFFQNAKGRTYSRYGGREDHDAESHLNKKSLMRVMRQVLSLHRDGKVQPASRYEPVAKSVKTPTDTPTMKAMMARRKNSCIHCHDVKVAQLRHLRDQGKLDRDMVFSYPTPSRLGIHLDPEMQDRVRRVDAKSPAEAVGIRAGDLIRTIDGQRVLTLSDMTRVLELAPKKTGAVKFGIERGKKTISTTVRLANGWRTSKDPSWRQSTGVLGPNVDFWGVVASTTQRKRLGLGDDVMAIRITYLKTRSRKAGLRLNDYLLSIDGMKSNINTRQLHAYVHLNRKWGDTIPLVVRRGSKTVKLSLKLSPRPPK